MYLNSWNMYIKVLNLQEYELPFSLRFQERLFLKEKNKFIALQNKRIGINSELEN